jgi:hypothetical protein
LELAVEFDFAEGTSIGADGALDLPEPELGAGVRLRAVRAGKSRARVESGQRGFSQPDLVAHEPRGHDDGEAEHGERRQKEPATAGGGGQQERYRKDKQGDEDDALAPVQRAGAGQDTDQQPRAGRGAVDGPVHDEQQGGDQWHLNGLGHHRRIDGQEHRIHGGLRGGAQADCVPPEPPSEKPDQHHGDGAQHAACDLVPVLSVPDHLGHHGEERGV